MHLYFNVILKNLLVLPALLVLSIFFNVGCTNKNDNHDDSIQSTNISGYVIDEPIVGATIEIYDDNGNLLVKEVNATDSSGYFNIKNLKQVQNYTIKVFDKGEELYTVTADNKKINKNIILSPLTLLNIDLNTSNPINYIEKIDNLKKVLNVTNVTPLELNKIINNSDKSYLKTELDKYTNSTYNAKCFYKIGSFPKKVACFSTYPKNSRVVWNVGDVNITKENVLFDFNESQNINVSVYDSSDNKVYSRTILVTGDTITQSKRVSNIHIQDINISLDNYSVDIPSGAFDNNTSIAIASGKGILSATLSPVSDKVITVTPSNTSVSYEPVIVKIPLNDQAIYLAKHDLLRILKKDENGEMLLKPTIDYDKKLASIQIVSFSKMQAISIQETYSVDDFITALNDKSRSFGTDKKTFYDILSSLSNEKVKKILDDIRDKKINVQDILNKKIGDSQETLASSLIKLYNQLAYMDKYFTENKPNYSLFLKDFYRNNMNAQQDLNPKVFKIIADAVSTASDAEIYKFTIGSYSIALKVSDLNIPNIINQGWNVGSAYTETFNKYFDKVTIITDFAAAYYDEDPLKYTISSLWEKTYFLRAPSLVTFAVNAYIDASFEAIQGASKKVEAISGAIDNGAIQTLLEASGKMENTQEWWQRVKNNLPLNQYPYLKLDTKRDMIIFGKELHYLSGYDEYEFNKADFFVFYNLWKNNPHKTIIEKNDFIKTNIGILLNLIDSVIQHQSEDKLQFQFNKNLNSTNSADMPNKSFTIDDNTALFTFKPQNGYIAKNVHLIIHDNQDDKNIVDKTYPPMASDDNLTVYGKDLAFNYNETHTLDIKISGDIYENGIISNTKLYPFSLNKRADIKKIQQYQNVKVSEFINNANTLVIGSIDINTSGGIKARLVNTENSNLNQYNYFTMRNGYITFYDKSKNEIFISSFSMSHYDDAGTTVFVDDLANDVLLAINDKDIIYASIRGDFSLEDDKYKQPIKIPYNYNLSLKNRVSNINNQFKNSKMRFEVELKPVLDDVNDIIQGVSFKKALILSDENISGVLSILDDGQLLYKTDINASNQWKSLSLNKKITRSGDLTFKFSPKGKDDSYASTDTISYILHSEKATTLNIDGYSVKKDTIGKITGVTVKFKTTTKNFIKPDTKYHIFYLFNDNDEPIRIAVDGKNIENNEGVYAYDIPYYFTDDLYSLKFKIVLANDTDPDKTAFEKIIIDTVTNLSNYLISFKNGYATQLDQGEYQGVFNFTIANDDLSKKLCNKEVSLDTISFNSLRYFTNTETYSLDNSCKNIEVKRKINIYDFQYKTGSSITFTFKNLQNETSSFYHPNIDILKYLSISKPMECVSNVSVNFAQYNVANISYDVYNNQSCQNISIDFGDGTVNSYNTQLGKKNTVPHYYPAENHQYQVLIKTASGEVKQTVNVYREYLFSDKIVKLILEGKVTDYPYGDVKDLLRLDKTSDYDHDGLNNYGEFYYSFDEYYFDKNLTAHNYSFKGWYKGLNPFNKDSDGDGFTDKQEINDISNGNPLLNNDNDDFDNDGLTNKEEFSIGTNPLHIDSDYDGIDDTTEVELSKNPNYKNQNISPTKKNNYYIDTDKDGIIDICETYPSKDLGLFSSISDNEGNKYSDINCSEKYLQQKTNPLKADTDGDGMPDGYERKKEICSGQVDAYSNGEPLWQCFNNTLDATDSLDAQKDFDNDGLPNIEEYKNKSNPYQFSSIRNGISDGFAVKYNLVAENEAYKNNHDTDSDGIKDIVEYQQDTDPTKAYIKIVPSNAADLNTTSFNKYFPQDKVLVRVYQSYEANATVINIEDFETNSSQVLQSTLNFEGQPQITKIQGKIYIYYLYKGQFKQEVGEIVLAFDNASKQYKITYQNNYDGYLRSYEDIWNPNNPNINQDNYTDYLENIYDKNNSQPLYIDDLNNTQQEYSYLLDGNTTLLLPHKSLGDFSPANFSGANGYLTSDFKLITYPKDQNGIPYFYLNKFWKDDANNNGIKDKDEYNNHRYKYIDIEKVKQYDTDGDGLSDLDEIFKYFTNPLIGDSDGDDLNDSAEMKLGTDPLVKDTDGDGLPDGYEVSHKNKKRLIVVDLSLYTITTTMDDKNISVVDTSLLSYAQNFAEGNETKPDEYSSASHFIWSNNDGNITVKFKETGEVYHFKYKSTPTDPLKYDSDGDGMGDGYEIAFHLDASDVNDKAYSPAMLLLDKNLIKPQIQKTNLQNYQDKYSPLISMYNPYAADTDKDGLNDASEYFWNLNPTDSSDADKDSDNDGLSNKEEILYTSSYRDGLNPNNNDTDNDGLPDGWEVKYKEISPLVADSSKKYKIFQYTWYQYYTGYMDANIDQTKINLNEGSSYNIVYKINTINQNKGKVYIDFGDNQNLTKEINPDVNSFSLQHTYSSKLQYKPVIKFMDMNGTVISSKVMDLTIFYNKVPKIDFIAIPTKGEVILRSSFACKSNDTDGNITKQWIDFGDGSAPIEILSDNNIIHSYTIDGQYTATCYAMDDKNATSIKNITIDVNKSSQETYRTTVDENNTLIAYVEENQISAINLNMTNDNNLSYYISGTDASSFDIDSSTGIITFKIAPDYETKTAYTFVLTVTDGVNKIDQKVIINILNINDNNPVFTSPNTISVNENQTSAIKLIARDDDNDTLTYSLSGTDASSFDINSSTGVVTFKVAPDYETKTSYNFIATVTDGVNSVSQNMTINILNINDNNPVFTSQNTVSVNENQTSAIRLTAKDDDNDTLTYSLSGTDASSFDINSSTGVVTFKVAPDYETKTSYNFIATVTDGVNSVSQNITINILNVVESSLFTLNGGSKNYIGKFDAKNHIDYVAVSNDQTKAFVADAGIALKILDISNLTSPTLLGSYNFYYINSVAISNDGNKAFVADDRNGLKILDISDPASPTLVGSYNTDGYAKSVTLVSDDSKAFIADGWGKGIKILDVSNPASPTLLASYQTTNALSITLSKDATKAFIADERGGIKILDVTDSTSPTLLGSKTDIYANTIVLSADETKAFIASGYDGIKILDVSNPSSPTLVGSYDTDGFAKSITLSNNETKAFVADSDGGIKVIDISDPSSPTLLQHYSTENAVQFVTISANENKAFVADGNLKIIDLINPATSALLGHYTTSSASSVSIFQNVVYVADGDKGIKILDISNPTSPKLIKTYYTTGTVESVTISKDKNRLFVADGLEGVTILDVSNPVSPTLLGSYSAGRYEDYAYAIALIPNSTKIAVADDGYGGLKILDISDPTSPTLIGSYSSCAPQSIAVSKDGTKAVITDRQNGIKILDISNPVSPILVGTFATTNAQEVTLSQDDSKAFVADGGSSLNDPSGSGLKIIDISDPSSPSLIGSYNTNDWANSVTISNDDSKVFLTVKNQGIKVIDISDLSSPFLLANYNTTKANSMALSNDNTKAFVADDNQGLKILDITKDTIYKPINFGNTNINLKLSSLNNKTFTMSVKANRSDIVTIGTYDTQISPNEYKNGYIEIPIESIAGEAGQTILTVTLDDGGDTLTRTIYLNIYP